MISDPNKEKWLKWCRARLEEGDTFDNVVWTDECTVQLDSYRVKSYYKEGQPAPLKQSRNILLRLMCGQGYLHKAPPL